MFGKRRRSGMGLGGLLIIGGVLYFSGAGKWMWDRTKQLDDQCYGLLVDIGTSIGNGVCGGMGRAIDTVDGVFNDVGGTMEGIWEKVSAPFGGGSFESVVGNLHITSALEKLGSSKEELMQRLRVGPESMRSGGDAGQQIRNALDSFSISQSFLSDGGGASRALPWLQQGATVPGYGVMSQLSLGDIYAQGAQGVGQNNGAAIQYYTQAYQSIGMLSQSSSGEAQSVLKALPGSPQDMQAKILATIRELKSKAQ